MSQSKYSTVLICWLVLASMMSTSALAGHSFNMDSKASSHDAFSAGEVFARVVTTAELWRHSFGSLKSARAAQLADAFASLPGEFSVRTLERRHVLSQGSALVCSGAKLQV
jgi:hypothetical protein